MLLGSKASVFSILIRLVHLMNLKDKYTKNHCKNVSYYATLLGKELNLTEEELQLIEIGGMLHDIGKLKIPNNILNKKGSLTSQEFEIMKEHPTVGESFLPIDGYEEIKRMIRNHHERIDGSGYPDGLKDSEIPYFAKILSIADTFDAMTTQRPYNKRKTLEEAIEELYRSSKNINCDDRIVQQLDPYLVDIFVKAINKDPYLLAEFEKADEEIIKERQENAYQKFKPRVSTREF